MATKSKFKPLLVSFDQEGYDRAQYDAKRKLELLNQASVWIHEQLDVDNAGIDFSLLHLNMTRCFTLILEDFYKDANTLGLSNEKLMEVKQIPIQELKEIQKKYEAIRSEIDFEGNVPYIKVDKSRYEKYTTNEKQNKKVIYANQFIKSLYDLQDSLHIKIYPREVMTATSGFILHNRRTKRYSINPQFIF